MSNSNPETTERNINCENVHFHGPEEHQHNHEHHYNPQFHMTKKIKLDTNIEHNVENQCNNFNLHVQNVYLPGCRNTAEESHVESLTKQAIQKAIEYQKGTIGDDVILHGLETDVENLPVVYPKFEQDDFYRGIDPKQKEVFVPSSHQVTAEDFARKKLVPFADLIKLVNKKKFTALIGPPGCGKTTSSKRLARAVNDLVPIHLRFMEMNYEEKLTLKQLFVDYLFPGLKKADKEMAFQWMVENPEKCVFIMDGFDQATWSLENMKPIGAEYDTPLSIQQLVANLCSKKFFKDSMLIFTSRPHAMISIPSELRPDVTINIHDLSTDDMKKLFYAFAGEDSDDLWDMLNTKAPQLFELCHTPLLLQFIIIAALYSKADDIASVNTITGVFKAVLEHLRHSDHARGQDINLLWEPLGRMAYKGMVRKSVVFKIKDLWDEGLEDVNVQDLVIVIARHLAFNQRLFDGDKILYFMHQMLQEIFAAMYISQYMPEEEFNEIIDEIVAGGHWAMVRRFMCGLLLDKEVCGAKQSTFMSKLLQKFRKCLTDDDRLDVNEIMIDLLECCDAVVIEFVSNLPTDINLNLATMSAIAMHALNHLLVKLERPVESLNLSGCGMDEKCVSRFLGSVKDIKHKMKMLDLSRNDNVGKLAKELSACVDTTDELYLSSCKMTDLTALVEGIGKRKGPIKCLDLSGNEFGNVGINKLAPVVTNIEQMKVSSCDITDLYELSTQLSQGDHMIKLDISHNDLSEKNGMDQLALCIDHIVELDVKHCKISDLELFAKSMNEQNATLECLNMEGCPIESKGVEHLATCIQHIKCLELPRCGISSVQPLTESIAEHRYKMVLLSFRQNPIGNIGLEHLSACLLYIQELNLMSCGITDLRVFTEAMIHLQAMLKSVNLSQNKFGNDGVNQLSRCSWQIGGLIASDCNITDPTSLLNAVAQRKTKMTALDLGMNKFSDIGAEFFTQCLGKIDVLSIYQCEISNAVEQKLKETLTELNLPDSTLKLKISYDVPW
uniref:Uncharacterized protein LOC104266015 n=1 Tax=Phallusia mammillata TaxID=59560 RepID=A0A6F9DJ11_9ASCI|nr:uncharacterized protein LOC104266015 [Phallusia mammillata]